MPAELLQRQFKPIFDQNNQVLTYAYSPESMPNNVGADFIVSKTPDTRQFIIGRKPDVLPYAKAFNLLESIGCVPENRNISIIIYPLNEMNKEDTDYLNFIIETMKQFGLYDRIKDTKYNKKFISGIFPDLREISFCDTKLEWLSDYDDINKSIQIIDNASTIVHEDEHIHQFCNGLPTNSLWAERRALSKQAEFYSKMINSIFLKNRQEKILLYLIQERCSRIYEYRNGRGFGDHKSVDLQEGSPTQKEDFNNKDIDFIFGY